MTLPLAKHTLFCNSSNLIILFWTIDTSLLNVVTIQLYIANDACQPQIDPHNCYFEHLIIHTEKLTIPFDRHTLQWWLSQNLGNGFCQICFVQRWTHFENCCHHLSKKVGLIWQQGGFSLHWLQYSVHKCDCWLEIVYHSWFSPSLKPFETKLGKSARQRKFTIDFAHVNLFVWLSFEQLSWDTLK